MMRSMFSGVSGLRNHQVRMDVIGNNIANVNTIGFKGSRVNFQDILSQTMQGAAAPQGNRGGTNPMQVGLGVGVASIDTIFTDGSTQTTGKQTDLAMQGQGFFILKDGNKSFYTRAGNFDFDTDGNYIVPGTGMKVQGWQADINGNITIDPTTIQDVVVPVGTSIQAQPTSEIVFSKNLQSDVVVGTQINTSTTIYDSQGNEHLINIVFEKTANNAWDWTASSTDPTVNITAGMGPNGITFDGVGNFTGVNGSLDITFTNGANPIAGLAVTFDDANSALTQYSSESTVNGVGDGYAVGTLETVTIDTSGVITGRYSNGISRPLYQVALATFNNPAGLLKAAENMYEMSNNSGGPLIGSANSGGRGKIAPGTLEMSNVDLSQQFTDMIVTQRGFQANSKIITTSDEMLQELVNLKR